MDIESFEAEVKPVASKGRKLFPLVNKSKRPLKNGWFKCASKTTDQILTNLYNAHNNHGGCGVGMIVGKEQGIIAIDLDYKHPEATEFYEEWKEELNEGICIKTGNGNHYYFTHPYLADEGKLLMSSIGGMHIGVDLIADTSEGAEPRYLVVPPTVHASGASYKYDNDFGETLADDTPDMPPRLLAYVCDPNFWPVKTVTQYDGESKGAEWFAENPHALFNVDPYSDEPISEGGRNQELSRIAGKILHTHDFDDNYQLQNLMDDMNEINENRCDPMLDEEEVDAMCSSIWKTRRRKEASAAAKADRLANAAKVEEAESFEPESAPEPESTANPLAQGINSNVLSQDEFGNAGSTVGAGVSNASAMVCPEEQPNPKESPNMAAIWQLFQPPYAPEYEGGDFNLIKLDTSFYMYCDNVWCPVAEASVKNVIQNHFMNATRSTIENMMSFLKNYLYYPVQSMPFWKSGKAPAGYPSDPRKLIVFKNGMFDVEEYLRTGGNKTTSLKPFHSDLFTTIKLRYDYDPNAKCDEWRKFLASIWDSETSDRSLALKEWMGHVMIPDTSQHKVGILHGVPRAGKSTIQNVIEELVGKQNCTTTNLNSLSTEHGIAPLVGKSLALIPDAHKPTGRSDRSLEVIKSISGGDPQQINAKFQDQYSVKLSARFMLICNDVPQMKDSGNALLARLLPFRFDRRFHTPDRPGRNDLGSILLSEVSGIANWAIEGIMSYVSRGYIMMPKEGLEDVYRMKRTLNPIGAFADDILSHTAGKWTAVDDMYSAWLDWADDAGISHTGTKDGFINKLRIVQVPEREMRRGGQSMWKGVTINEVALKALTADGEDF